jgi:hypothetical protein
VWQLYPLGLLDRKGLVDKKEYRELSGLLDRRAYRELLEPQVLLELLAHKDCRE